MNKEYEVGTMLSHLGGTSRNLANAAALGLEQRDFNIEMLEVRRQTAQAIEILRIESDATHIEELLARKNLPLPTAYAVFTGGFEVPPNSIKIGTYGRKPFQNFPRPGILGHAGEVYMAPHSQDNHVMIFQGRAHPTEWSNEEFGDMIVAHQLRVVKELIRRQRARDGNNPPVILTYLTGVGEGYPMQTGDVGIILDDSELTNVSHPGHGPTALLDTFDGSHFQPKMGRASDPYLAKIFLDSAALQQTQEHVFPVAAIGTPGATEYQSAFEAGLVLSAFDSGVARTGLPALADSIFGEGGGSRLSPLFDMGITFELATMRQTKPDEQDFPVLALGLATDSVGGVQSENINHMDVISAAMGTGPRNTQLIMEFLRAAEANPLSTPQDGFGDFSIQTQLSQLECFKALR